MDKAAIFTEITERNKLRKEARLPLLNVRAEFDQQVALAAYREFREAAERFADQRAMIEQTVLEEFRARLGEDFGYSSFTGMGVRAETDRRFRSFLARHNIFAPMVRS